MMTLALMRPAEVVDQLGKRLKYQRVARRLTQADLAARIDVSTPTISNLENGKNTSFETVIKVALTLGLENDLEDIFKLKTVSIADLERYSALPERVRNRSCDKGDTQFLK